MPSTQTLAKEHVADIDVLAAVVKEGVVTSFLAFAVVMMLSIAAACKSLKMIVTIHEM